ncbi:ricin-type beta-trefoil lectin domain protein [Inquilinus limosus]|uniref:Ca2+-dependent phosphoinositide-specific phospholipase C n=1 Tax=Inquilinus limosus TaxID=171674 RepID=UPI003F188FC4
MRRSLIFGAVVAAALLLSAATPALAQRLIPSPRPPGMIFTPRPIPPVPNAQPLLGTTPYNAAYWSRPHNAYERSQFARLTDALDRGNQVIELDVYDNSGLPVRHDWNGSNTDNNCRGGAGGMLRDCLRDIKAWSDAHPGHLPITIQLDLKPSEGLWGWGGQFMAALDSTVIQELGLKLYRPEVLRTYTGYASLREGVYRVGWPTVDALRGRIIVLMMGGPIGDKNDTQEEYVKQFGANAHIFVCPEAHIPTDFVWSSPANDFDDPATNQWVVCGNMKELKYWYRNTITAQQNGQLVNLWSDDHWQFDAYHQMYLAVGWGASMISRESVETWGGKLPLNGVRRSVPTRFTLSSEHSGYCVEIQSGVYGNGSDLNQFSCTDAVPQQWIYSDETQLQAVGNHKYCFDIEGGDGNNGDQLHIWDCDGGASEKWQLQPDGRLIGMNGRCADVVDTVLGRRLQIRNCTGAASQSFRIKAN